MGFFNPIFISYFCIIPISLKMISINLLQIDEFAEKINVDVNTTSGNKITKVYVWSSDTFKDYSKAIDLSSLIDGSDNTESFSIFAQEHLGVEKIVGLWFVEFESDEEIIPDNCIDNSNTGLGVVANLIPYHECVLNKLLAIEVDDCKPVINDGCDECSGNIYYINTLVTTLKDAIQFGYYEEAIRIIKTLDDLCDVCHTCPGYGDTLLINGLGFSTINNSLTDIRVDEPSDTFTPTISLVESFFGDSIEPITQPAPSFVVSNAFVVVNDGTTNTIVPFTNIGNSTLQLNEPIPITSTVIVGFNNFVYHQDGSQQKSYSYSSFVEDTIVVPVSYAS